MWRVSPGVDGPSGGHESRKRAAVGLLGRGPVRTQRMSGSRQLSVDGESSSTGPATASPRLPHSSRTARASPRRGDIGKSAIFQARPPPTRTGDLQVRSSQRGRTHPTRHPSTPENPRPFSIRWELAWARVGSISDTTRTRSAPRIRAAGGRAPSTLWGVPRGRRWSSPWPRGDPRRW
jgi:hypothetical protein